MIRKIIGDSSVDLNPELQAFMEVGKAPFPIELEGVTYMDDDTLDVKSYVAKMMASPNTPHTAAPSPGAYMELMSGADEVFCITISSKLSASYANAKLAAKEVMLEENNKVHVFDSLSASSGETSIAVEIQKRINDGKSFDEIVTEVEAFIGTMNTYFVLEDISNLVKNGRIPKLAGMALTRLSIKPVCCAKEGQIKVDELARGLKKAYANMVKKIAALATDAKDRTIYIAHVNCHERAEDIKRQILEAVPFHSAEILTTGGLSSTYASDGGIIISF